MTSAALTSWRILNTRRQVAEKTLRSPWMFTPDLLVAFSSGDGECEVANWWPHLSSCLLRSVWYSVPSLSVTDFSFVLGFILSLSTLPGSDDWFFSCRRAPEEFLANLIGFTTYARFVPFWEYPLCSFRNMRLRTSPVLNATEKCRLVVQSLVGIVHIMSNRVVFVDKLLNWRQKWVALNRQLTRSLSSVAR